MKLLVTGATGFIGRHVITEVLKRGHEVIAVSRNKNNASTIAWFDKVSFIDFDLEKDVATMQLMGEPDCLIHLAWDGLPNYKSLHHLEVNLPVSMRFIRSLVAGGLKHVLVTGTCFEFGMQNGALAPGMNTFPENPYAIAKDTLRMWIEKLHAEFEFTHQWVRLFYMYGPGQNAKSILSQLQQAMDESQPVFNMSGGEQLRDYLPVEKVAAKLVDFLEAPGSGGTKHCCSGKPVSIRTLVENYLQQHDKKIRLNLGYYPYPDYEPMAFWGVE